MARILVAVDPGQNGGIVWSVYGEPQMTCDKMPPTDVEVCQYIADLSLKAKDVDIYLEEPSVAGYGPLIPASSIARLAQNYGMIYGAAVAMGWSIHRVKPQAWQAIHALGKKKDHGKGWKNHLKARAMELYASRVDVTLWNCDALLIHYAAICGKIN
jgi:hypothetical protein